jgi:hypothetical protein
MASTASTMMGVVAVTTTSYRNLAPLASAGGEVLA